MRNRRSAIVACSVIAGLFGAAPVFAQAAKQVINAPNARPGVLSTAVKVGEFQGCPPN